MSTSRRLTKTDRECDVTKPSDNKVLMNVRILANLPNYGQNIYASHWNCLIYGCRAGRELRFWRWSHGKCKNRGLGAHSLAGSRVRHLGQDSQLRALGCCQVRPSKLQYQLMEDLIQEKVSSLKPIFSFETIDPILFAL